MLPTYVREALLRLNEAGFEAWLVGGCVRDRLMGAEPHDYDITTSATPEETEAVFAGERIIETVNHFYGHLEIGRCGSFGLCSVERKQDAEARKDEIIAFCSRILGR